MLASRVLPGLDLARLAEWLPAALPGAGTELSGRLIAGGKSSLTCEVTDGMSTWIVRRPPPGHVLARWRTTCHGSTG
jgi:aminoglycoside phosphotransferase (APT) family kinase protein